MREGAGECKELVVVVVVEEEEEVGARRCAGVDVAAAEAREVEVAVEVAEGV